MSDGQENALAWFDMFSFEFGCCKRSPNSLTTPRPAPTNAMRRGVVVVGQNVTSEPTTPWQQLASQSVMPATPQSPTLKDKYSDKKLWSSNLPAVHGATPPISRCLSAPLPSKNVESSSKKENVVKGLSAEKKRLNIKELEMPSFKGYNVKVRQSLQRAHSSSLKSSANA
mmetsp:Transcript_80332/g.130178  ORF Transcript_80332/g.130178 Transcript_80332/m.130178 type:complete len:170 (-) Transcript_80332:320-829(-)